MSSRVFTTTAVALLVAAALGMGGCHVFNRLLGKESVDLSKADIKSMSVDIRKERKTICPRENVQMAIFADIVPEGETKPQSVETWIGHGDANKNDKMEFVEFAFHSEHGVFDKDGWFAPNPDVLASAGTVFDIKTVYKRQPDKWSFNTTYKPDYQCITGGGKSGSVGVSGSAGTDGKDGAQGNSASSASAGGSGGDGSTGGSGADGGNGGNGPRLTVYATMVKTAFYDKLVAIKISGDFQDTLLAPVDHPITIAALGGAGGSGGEGGRGGRGGSGGSGNPGGEGGHGGGGGSGGKGGAGGNGGTIDLIYDARYPELASQIHLDVSGGQAGGAGPSGNGGSGGSGGSGMTPSSQGATSAPSGQNGSEGASGGQGANGQAGANGTSSAKAGAVADQFAQMSALSPIGAAAAATDGAAPVPAPQLKPLKGAKKKKASGT